MKVFSNPVRVTFGDGCFEGLLDSLKAMDNRNILLVTGKSGVSAVWGRLTEALSGKNCHNISNISPNPDIMELYARLKEIALNGFAPDLILAIGGGSVLDTAKALKALLGRDTVSVNELRRVIVEKSYSPINCPLVLCPTSAGTGSEVTKWATLWDRTEKLKHSIEHKSLYADKAYIDPQLTHTLPFKQSVYCAFDALSHAVESYWSPKSCKISREYSLKAIELFERVIDGFIDGACSPDERETLSASGYFAGLAFSHTRTTVCHAISYPLTMLYNVPHGIATCMSLSHMLEINAGAVSEIERLYGALNISEPSELNLKIHERLKSAEIPYKLSDYGFKKTDITSVAQKCFTPGRADNNPVKLGIEGIENILADL